MPTGAILPPRREEEAAGIEEDISRTLAASTAKMAVATQEKLATVRVTLALDPLPTREAPTTTIAPAVLPSTKLASEAPIGPALATLASNQAPTRALLSTVGPTADLLPLHPTVEEAAQATRAAPPLATAEVNKLEDFAARNRALQAGTASTDVV